MLTAGREELERVVVEGAGGLERSASAPSIVFKSASPIEPLPLAGAEAFPLVELAFVVARLADA